MVGLDERDSRDWLSAKELAAFQIDGILFKWNPMVVEYKTLFEWKLMAIEYMVDRRMTYVHFTTGESDS